MRASSKDLQDLLTLQELREAKSHAELVQAKLETDAAQEELSEASDLLTAVNKEWNRAQARPAIGLDQLRIITRKIALAAADFDARSSDLSACKESQQGAQRSHALSEHRTSQIGSMLKKASRKEQARAEDKEARKFQSLRQALGRPRS